MPPAGPSGPKRRRRTPARANAAVLAPSHSGASEATYFPIVGIGASAGGFEAFSQMLKALPPNTGMAFVFVQHLEPEHESMLARLLSRIARMPVTEARNGMEVQPNNVYVIPPKADMSIQSGVLQIMGRRKMGGRYLPVDYFLGSLAADRRSQAIGVILSGTASDGTIGLKAIKSEGGVTFAQDEESSKYYGMPASAVAAGCVDHVLPPDRIGKELARLAQRLATGRARFPETPEKLPGGADDFVRILHLLRSASGVDFTEYKAGTIHRRVARRMVLRKANSVKEYADYLETNRAELDALFQDILIHVTGFFREPEAFKALQARTFPKILAGKKAGDPLRIWIPGCSTGEEVYSLAITLLEFLGERASTPPVQIFGTDIGEMAVGKARSGKYTDTSLHGVSAIRLRRFFSKTEDGYQVNKTIRDMCVFAKHDVTKDPPFSRIDLISCRNVLIYLGSAAQRRVVSAFHYSLLEDGFLLLGRSESLTAHPDLFEPFDRRARVYVRKANGGESRLQLPSVGKTITTPVARTPGESGPHEVLKEADRLVWQRYSHAGLVLNGDLEILHFRGEVSSYLSPTSGAASLNVLHMVREELKMELRSAIHRAKRTKAPARSAGVRVSHDGGILEVILEVVPMMQAGAKEPNFLVLFDGSRPLTAPPAGQKPAGHKRGSREEAREIARLRRDLAASREYVRSVVEQQEAANEQLKTANEEILSSNEELQSTNEELETAKEELQSTNEELVTLNETLQARNTELAQLADDLNNVLSGTTIPILIVGDDRRIRRFTPTAEKLLNLLPGDVGRPIAKIRPNIDLGELDALMTEVGDTLSERQRELRDGSGRWHLMRVRPYRTGDNRVDGALIAFYDIDELKRSKDSLRETEATVSALVETVAQGIILVDGEGRIALVNAGAEKIFGYRQEEMIARPLEMLLPEQVRGAHARHRAGYFSEPGIRDMAAGRQPAGRRKDGSEFPVEVSLSYIDAPGKRLATASVADVTELRRAEAALAERSAALQLSQARLGRLTAGLLSAQEEERERLARELHDGLNQQLAELSMRAETMAQKIPDSETELKDNVRALHGSLGKLSDHIHRLAHDLHPSILEHFGLAAALRSHCEEFSALAGIKVRFRQREVPELIPEDTALCLYRVAQECLQNVAKHSGAQSASVLLAGVSDAIHLAVSDRGAGFDPEQTGEGMGLVSIAERVRIAGGTVSVRSRLGEGVRVEVRIPLDRAGT